MDAAGVYVFVQGYWDYELNRRGVLFAPVYFPRAVYRRPGFSYSLSVVVDIGNLQFSLFTSPRYSHYYFGDYYDDAYIGIGIYPWFECERRHTWYDPIYEHSRWHFHNTYPRWDEHERNEYDLRRSNKNLRPPRTYHEMENRLIRLPESKRGNIRMAQPLDAYVANRRSPLRFENIKSDDRERLSKQSTDVYSFRQERSRWESPRPGQKTVQPSIERKLRMTKPEQVKIPSSPVTGKRDILNFFKKSPPSRPAYERTNQMRDNRGTKGDRDKNN